jgi:hypothetical protein
MLALSVYAFCVQYVYDSTQSQGRQQLAYGKPGLLTSLFPLPLPARKKEETSMWGGGLAANQSDL